MILTCRSQRTGEPWVRSKECGVTITDLLAVYAAILATALGAWDVAKYVLDRPRLKVACYVAKIVDLQEESSSGDLLAYRVANTGGKPIIVSSVGGTYRNGKQFMLVPNMVALPKSLQPGEYISISGLLPNDVDRVDHFWVADGLGKEWKVTAKTVMKELKSRDNR
jgi:hypothetical protein